MKNHNGQLEFNKNDGIFLRQLALTAMSAKSMRDNKGPVTKFAGKEDYFFNNLHNMTFDLKKRRFEVAGAPSFFRIRYVTRKAVGKANEALAGAETALVEKAGQLIHQRLQNAGLAEVEEYVKRQLGLSNEDMKAIVLDSFLPAFTEAVMS